MKRGRPISLSNFQKMFRRIYYEKDARDFTPADLLLHIQEEAAKIDEGIRKNNEREIINALPNFFCWLLSFCNIYGIDLETVVLAKYNGCCPYCGKEENCMCITMDQKPSKWYSTLNSPRISTLNDWQKMFQRIYGRINKIPWPIQLWLHVHEELGEFRREIRLKNDSEAADELADCFAWLIAFCNRIGVNLGEIVWRAYPGMCPVCGKEKCLCPVV